MPARAVSHAVCRTGDLRPGEVRAAQVDGISIAVARKRDGSFRALRDRCPHQGGSLSEGRCQAYLHGPDVGSYVMSEERDVVRCPWHHFEFDLDTGLSVADPGRYRVRSYPTRVDGDQVIVDR
jgi:3-phenylpropionate/trans-cinnamate dioxygenase ferredoxin subunit